uniref:Leucine-rich repeat protein n=1 Tax=Tanacetum cinerariifolium TaxID=118510 RepID=A0A6L2NW19_TANCI|nr:leucine-rich repeat protein [Tanacetum cinerariifolium]
MKAVSSVVIVAMVVLLMAEVQVTKAVYCDDNDKKGKNKEDGTTTSGIRAGLDPVVVLMVFPRLDPSSTVLVDPSKPCTERKSVKGEGCDVALETLPADMEAGEKVALMKKAYNTLILCLGDQVQKLDDHIDEFNKLILDLANIDIKIKDEDHALMLLTSLPSSYKNFMETLLYGRESLTIEDVLVTLSSRELNKKTKGTKEETGDGLYVRGRSDHSEGHLKTDCPMKKSSGFVKKGKRDQDSNSSNDDGNAYFGKALAVVENGEITKLKVKIQLHDGSNFGRCQVCSRAKKKFDLIGKNNCVYTLEAKLMTFGGRNHRGVHGVQDEKRVWFEVELQGAQGDHEAEVFRISNDDTVVAQRWLEDKQLEEKTNTDCLVKEQEKVHLGIKVGANIMVIGVPSQEGTEGNVSEKMKVKESNKANLWKLLNFHGPIPSSFQNLTSLQVLHVSENDFINSSLVSEELSNSNLTSLDIRSCGVSSSVLGSIHNLTSLLNLDISENQLTKSTLPKSLCNDLFSGVIAECWEKWTELKFLNFENNNFSGGIPRTLSSLYNLQSLTMRGNKLLGRLPDSLMNLMNLNILQLGGNKLVGSIPTWLGRELSFLTLVNLRSNKFGGIVPTEICNLVYVQILDLADNNLSFNESNFFDNQLYGAPLADRCMEVKVTGTNNNEKDDGSHGADWDLVISMVLGFIVGFWVIVAPLIVSKSWRNGYFRFLSKLMVFDVIRTIKTWDEIRADFISRFFPPDIFDQLLREIRAFSQHENESLTNAWLRIKEMLRNCHGHNLSKGNIIKIFYHGLNEIAQEVLNAATGSIFLYKTPNQAYHLLEDKVLLKLDWAKNQKTKSSLKKTVAFADEGSSNFDTDKIMARMDAMTIKMDAQYKELQSCAKQTIPDLNKNDIPMSREEKAKFMQTFCKTRFYNDYRDRDSNRDN